MSENKQYETIDSSFKVKRASVLLKNIHYGLKSHGVRSTNVMSWGGYYHYIKRRIVTYRKQTYLYILNRYIIIEQIINDQTLIHSIKQR